jgi:hypothetical protein
MVQQPLGPSSLQRLYDHTWACQTRQDSSGRVIEPTQRSLPENAQHSQETDIHAPAGFETAIPSQQAEAADPRLRPRNHWDRPLYKYTYI